MQPTVSVLIPTYNRAHFLVECLDSVLNQSLPPTQIIIINDGSPDNTREVLQPYRDRILYLEKENGGKASALNVGMSHVTGTYVWIMDDDDVSLPDALERHVTLLEKRPELGFTYSSLVLAETHPEDGRIIPGRERALPEVSEEEFFLRKLERVFLGQPAVVVRTSCYRAVGPFRPDMERSQDYEMILRLARRFRCARIDGPTYYHRKHAGDRGTLTNPLPVGRLPQLRRHYQERLFRELRQKLRLSEYLPKTFDRQPPEEPHSRRAYLQRMTIMASHGLYEEMLEDLNEAVARSYVSQPLSAAERALFPRLATYVWPHYKAFFHASFLKKVRARCQGPTGRAIRLEFTRAFASRAYVSFRAKAFRDALRSARAAFYLGGLTDMGALTLRRLGRAIRPQQDSSPRGPHPSSS